MVVTVSVRVLLACQALTVEIAGGPAVTCGEPGQWWDAPNGKRYVLCDHHLAVFSEELGR